jgi:poly(A) polymerase
MPSMPTLSSPSPSPSPALSSSLEAGYCYRWSAPEQSWELAEESALSPVAAAAPVAQLRCVTFNVLFDLYDADKIHTALRIPAMLELLRRTNADLIGLQEVTPPFLDALGAQGRLAKLIGFFNPC